VHELSPVVQFHWKQRHHQPLRIGTIGVQLLGLIKQPEASNRSSASIASYASPGRAISGRPVSMPVGGGVAKPHLKSRMSAL
jgi:hypothetical protein